MQTMKTLMSKDWTWALSWFAGLRELWEIKCSSPKMNSCHWHWKHVTFAGRLELTYNTLVVCLSHQPLLPPLRNVEITHLNGDSSRKLWVVFFFFIFTLTATQEQCLWEITEQVVKPTSFLKDLCFLPTQLLLNKKTMSKVQEQYQALKLSIWWSVKIQ